MKHVLKTAGLCLVMSVWFSVAAFGQGASVTARAACAAALPESCTVTITLSVTIAPSLEESLGSFTGRLSWEPTNLRFVRHAGLPAGFIGFVNTTRAANGEIAFNGANAEGAGSNVEILKLDFLVIGAAGRTGAVNVAYDAMTAAGTFTNLRPLLAIENGPYTVAAGNLLGDVDGNGLVNFTDGNLILAFDVGFTIPQAHLARINADVGNVNRDDATNSSDALIIFAFAVGQTVPFPLGKRSCP